VPAPDFRALAGEPKAHEQLPLVSLIPPAPLRPLATAAPPPIKVFALAADFHKYIGDFSGRIACFRYN
jgi:hypothetical protein